MTNLDSILKSRDISLPTKVCLVKAMVFSVVMYGCESWTVKKAECRRIDGRCQLTQEGARTASCLLPDGGQAGTASFLLNCLVYFKLCP